jgi:hypothetical protein
MKKILIALGALISFSSNAQQIPTSNGLGTNSPNYWSRAGNSGNGANGQNNIFGTKWNSPIFFITGGLTQQKLGVSIKRRGECQFLSDAILVEFGESLNYNTIRRFFGVDKGPAIASSINTLDILSRFLGYESYYEFCKKVSSIGANEYVEEWYAIFHSGSSEQIISYFLEKRRKNVSFIKFFIQGVRELLLFGKIGIVDKVYRCSELKLDELSYSELIHMGNAVGMLLRDINLRKEDYLFLLNNKVFVMSVFLIFVDYKSLNKGYGTVVNLAQNNNEIFEENEIQFFKCLGYFQELLLKKELNIQSNCDITTFDAHPILIGRIAAIELLKYRHQPLNKRSIFDKLMDRYKSDKIKRIDYFYEVHIIAITLSDFELMSWLREANKETHIQEYYHISHYQASRLTDLLFCIYQKDEEKQNILLSKIKPELWVSSYSDFFDLFYTIALYHRSEQKKKVLRNKYLGLSQQLDYPIFDEKFLLSYFD